jgi:hypothetical protein
MTVSEALAAHASAQIARAQQSDKARQGMADSVVMKTESRSFIESWSFQATVIGWNKDRAEA